jgi:CRISPR-associated endonuclease/helicase Cas3
MTDSIERQFYAHTRDGEPPENWQFLEDHLRQTAETARLFANAFDAGDWAYLAGLWHDMGKYSQDFQQLLIDSQVDDTTAKKHNRRVNHSTAGALHAVERFGMAGRIFAYLIAGHHAGMPDWTADESGNAALSIRLKDTAFLEAIRSAIPNDIMNHLLPKQRPAKGTDPALWIRMLFSCLVDADFLDTEAFMDPDKTKWRGEYARIGDLLPLFTSYMDEKSGNASHTPVNQLRTKILGWCREAAKGSPGAYTLTVPTGGGKTLSSMAFALHHAVRREKRRIIYVIPYTSIIEQTADQFRQIFGDAVIEHHSNFDGDSDDSDDYNRGRLACENWDAPLIVTTSVQFFESLFANRSSRCRKLHNIANSIVILDEVQLLPPEFLKPILHALNQLRTHFGVTLLLMTATQPAFHPQPAVRFDGLPNTVEIIPDPDELHKKLKRTEIKIPQTLLESREWQEIAEELQEHDTILCIVNSRKDCRTLWEMMPEGTYHLSALMCGAHRSQRIAAIKERLKDGKPIRVISTQLVEAGVDLDFPVVYRAIAGLDSIAQAAGRCNREGRLSMGKVVVFSPPGEPPVGHLRQAAQIGRRMLHEGAADPLTPAQFNKFFEELYWLQGDRLDAKDILSDLQADGNFQFSFRTAAGKFQIIDDACQAPVLVQYGEGAKFIALLEKRGPERWLMRKLQRYTINIPRYLHDRLKTDGGIREVYPGIYVQGHTALYHQDLGFCPDRSAIYRPDDLIC